MCPAIEKSRYKTENWDLSRGLSNPNEIIITDSLGQMHNILLPNRAYSVDIGGDRIEKQKQNFTEIALLIQIVRQICIGPEPLGIQKIRLLR